MGGLPIYRFGFLQFTGTLHRGAFCQFLFRWIYYYDSNKSAGKETRKTHLCAMVEKETWALTTLSIVDCKYSNPQLCGWWYYQLNCALPHCAYYDLVFSLLYGGGLQIKIFTLLFKYMAWLLFTKPPKKTTLVGSSQFHPKNICTYFYELYKGANI